MLKQLLLLPGIIAFMFSAESAFAQTPGELESKYGPPTDAYVIRPGLLMTAKHAVSGQVCEASIIEARTPGSNINFRTPLTTQIVPELIDELIPEGRRGK